MAAVHIDKVKDTHLIAFFSSSPPISRTISPFGSKITIEVLHCIAFGLQKNLVFPAPEPPQTKKFKFRRCFFRLSLYGHSG